MTIEEMKSKKKELGYTNEKIAELSKVPLGTVQKIFSGETKSPRYSTIQKLIKVLGDGISRDYTYDPESPAGYSVAEYNATYGTVFYDYHKKREKKTKRVHNAEYAPVPLENRLGVAAGKFIIPDDIDFCNDEIWEEFSEDVL